MTNRTIAAMTWLLLSGMSSAAECRLDQATYIEVQSGAVLTFHPKTAQHGLMTSGVFTLKLPNMGESFAGEITWAAGRNARPDGSVRRDCEEPESLEYPGACWLWLGNVYAVGKGTIGLVDDEDMAAPQGILLADFGRSLLWSESFVAANPRALAMDFFTLSACRS